MESKIEEIEGHIDLLKSDLHRLNLSFARWEKQLTDEKDEMNAKKKERLKLLEEMLNALQEKLRSNLEDTEDLKNREEQLELLIGKHHETLIAHNRRMNSLKPHAQPIPTPSHPGFGPTTKPSVTPEMEVKIPLTEELDYNRTSGSNKTKTTSVEITESNDETTAPSLQIAAEDTESHSDGEAEATAEIIDPTVLKIDEVPGALPAPTEPAPISNLNLGMNTNTVSETNTMQDSSLKPTSSNGSEQPLEENQKDDNEDDSKDNLNEDLEDKDIQQDSNEDHVEDLQKDADEDHEEDREEDRNEDIKEDLTGNQNKYADEDLEDNKHDFEDLKEVVTENQDGSLEGSEEQSV